MNRGDVHLALFGDLADKDVAEAVARLKRRTFPSGSVVIAAGHLLRELYVVTSGLAEVVVVDRDGTEHRLAEVGAGEPLGEVSLFTGQPGAADVRAATDLEVVVVGEDDLKTIGSRFPQLYRNLGTVLAHRLERTDRLAAHEQQGRLALLEDDGTRPLLGVELAASVAWHARRPAILLVVTDKPADELLALAARFRDGGSAVEIRILDADEPADEVRKLAGSLREDYDFVLVQTSREAAPFPDARVVKPADVPALPPLDEEEQAALRNGLLAPTGAAGRALAPLARELAGLRVGLALGGGSLRGYAHVGVLRTLERNRIPIDFLSGASVGATVAGLYAVGNDPDRCADMLDLLGEAMVRPAVPRKGLLSARALRKLVTARWPDQQIEDLPIPLGVVTADIDTQEEVVLRNGNLGLALLAATAIPGIYPAIRLGEHMLVDGGVLDPVPAGVVEAMGADIVIAVRLGAHSLSPVPGHAVETSGPIPSALSVLHSSIDLMQTRIGMEPGTVPTVTITPEFAELPSGHLRHFRLGRRYVEAGEAAAEEALPRIAALLPWLRK